MITLGNYIRIILEKKGLKQQDVVNKINELGLMEGGAIFTKQKLSNILNGQAPLSKENCNRIEIALGLPKSSLNRFINC